MMPRRFLLMLAIAVGSAATNFVAVVVAAAASVSTSRTGPDVWRYIAHRQQTQISGEAPLTANSTSIVVLGPTTARECS